MIYKIKKQFKIEILLGLLLLIYLGCSNLDSTTSIGSDVVNEIYQFDAVTFLDTADITSRTSYFDTGDSVPVGITQNSTIILGAFEDERTYGYLEYNGDSITTWIDSLSKATNTALIDIYFSFLIDTSRSNSGNAIIELGQIPLSSKILFEKIDTTNLNGMDIGHINTSDIDSSGFGKILISNAHFITDSTNQAVFTTTERVVKTEKSILEIKRVNHVYTLASNAISYDQDSLDLLHGSKVYVDTVIISDTSLIDTTIMITYDTSFTIKQIIPKMDTIQNSLTNTVKFSIYDTITTIEDLIELYGKKDSLITSNTVIIGDIDTTIYSDSLYTIADTLKTYNITKQYITAKIRGEVYDTIFDTSRIYIEIDIDTIYQTAKTYTRPTINKQIIDSLFYDITDNGTIKKLCFYLKLTKNQSNTLKFLNSPKLILRYKDQTIITTSHINDNTKDTTYTFDTTSIDTLTKEFNTIYHDYSTYETNTPDFSTRPVISGASDRIASIAVDFSNLWNNIKDSVTGGIIYENIPKAILSLKIDSAIAHSKSAPDSLNLHFRYNLSNKPITSFDSVSTRISDITSVKNLKSGGYIKDFKIENFLIDILHENITLSENLSNTLYFNISFAERSFIQLYFDESSTPKVEINYIISNKRKGL